ncbi:MAG TPA: vWA domain-containing protein [Polyangiaceae bacterium]|nr:vWA domain-containing protein [Polyangiaceae bacterium]
MKTRNVVLFAALVAVGGCSAAGADPSTDSPTGTAPAAVTCNVSGQQPCFCPDGTESGTQSCLGGVLSSCSCPTVAPVGTDPGGTPTTAANLCSDLRGKRSCNATSYASQQVPSSILFVVDRSGSMACNAPPVQTVESCNSNPTRLDPNQPSRWETTVKALTDTFAGLSGSTASIGLSLFSTDGFCGVDSAPAVELGPASAVQLSALTNALSGDPAGGTPIVGAVIEAYHHLHEELHAPGNRYVVLITDGEESCGTQGDETDKADLQAARTLLLQTEVKKARDANIRTYVIGAPGSEGARGFLSELAFAGGTAKDPNCVHGEGTDGNCHFDLTAATDFSDVLGTTLKNISGRALGCEFKTPPGASALVNVQYSQNGGDPVCFPQADGPCEGGANGWQFAKDAAGNDDHGRVVLCGQACETVKADPSTVVDVILGCQVLR